MPGDMWMCLSSFFSVKTFIANYHFTNTKNTSEMLVMCFSSSSPVHFSTYYDLNCKPLTPQAQCGYPSTMFYVNN